jgi:phosphoglycolate phosphatase-like HAD superfamily hydrolase
MSKIIVFDIDGTIADCTHRLHHVKKNNPDWKSFFEECVNDTPIESMCDMSMVLSQYYDIVFCTGRSEECREQTEEWLLKHVNSNALLMRKEGDHRPDHVVKKELLEDYLKLENLEKSSVITIYEDRQTVVDMWRDNGYHVCQVAKGDF